MIFLETSIFTKTISELLSDDLYRELQEILYKNPCSGDLIKGSNGLRKIRWKLPSQGKRGSIRVIYYWYKSGSKIYMLYAYKKNSQENLTTKQRDILSHLVSEEFKDE